MASNTSDSREAIVLWFYWVWDFMAVAGSTEQVPLLGTLQVLRGGKGVPRDRKAAFEWLQRGAGPCFFGEKDFQNSVEV